MSALGALDGDLTLALHDIGVPSYAIDSSGIIRWVNPAAERIVGDVVGKQFTSVVAPEETRRAREFFARKITGAQHATDAQAILVDGEGNRVKVDISAVALRDGQRIVGVFGQFPQVHPGPAPDALPHLTPRQNEILRLLEHGKSTEQIAAELVLSPETVRNHVRRLLRALGAHTRLEAVALARRGYHGPGGAGPG